MSPSSTTSKNILVDVADYYLQETFSDIKFLVGNEVLHSHKIILASRSQYFRTILLKNTQQSEIVISDVPVNVFKIVLKYIYTGVFDIEPTMIYNLLQAAEKYYVNSLVEKLVELIPSVLNSTNVVNFFNLANVTNIEQLKEICYEFFDKNIINMLADGCVAKFSQESMVDILQKRTFSLAELDVFRFVEKWCKYNEDDNDLVKNCVQLNRLSAENIIKMVQPTKLFDDQLLLEVIDEITNSIPEKVEKVVNVNIATVENGVNVITGERTCNLFKNNADDHVFTYHKENDKNGITVDLGGVRQFNHIKFKIVGCEKPYYLEISRDNLAWYKIVDYSKISCHSFQNLYFKPETAQYIKIVGLRLFDLKINNFEVMLKESSPEVVNQIVRPKQNVASEDMGARISQWNSRNSDYDRIHFKSNYVIPAGDCISIYFAQPYWLSTIKLTTIGKSKYSISIGDVVNEDLTIHKNNVDCEGLQIHQIQEKVAILILIRNTDTSEDLVFHSLECF